MRPTFDGVLMPDELLEASDDEKRTYAAQVKAGNRRVLEAVFALEDECERRGLDPRDVFGL